MKLSAIRNRILTIAAALLLAVGSLAAQTTTTTHIVVRGETISSIAADYGVTVDKIIALNPDAAQFIYVGMELTIPTTTATPPGELTQTWQTPNNSLPSTVVTGDSSTDIVDWSHFGIGYMASFDAADTGFYGLFGTVYTASGWGVNFNIGFDYGLVDSDWAGCTFLIGPAYGYIVHENILLDASLNFLGRYAGTGKGQKTGVGKNGEEYHYTGTDNEFNWGIAFMPRVVFKVGKVKPWVGLNANWAKDTDLDFGFEVGIGFNI